MPAVELTLEVPAHISNKRRTRQDFVNYFGCQRLNSAFASPQYRTNETTAPLKPSNPRPCLTFTGWAMPYHKTVTATCYFKIQIPAEIFLTWFFISLYALFAQLPITQFAKSSPKQHGLMKYS